MLIPIGDENPTQRLPFINYAFIAVNVLVFFLLNFRSDFRYIVIDYGFTPGEFGFITIFTSMFMHAGFFHMSGNMLYLWIFGDNVEETLGYYFIPLYLFWGFFASFAYYLSSPNSYIPCIGASGAISGVLGFYVILFPWHRIKFFYWWWIKAGTFYMAAFWAIGFWFLLQLLFGLLSSKSSGIAYWAHIGGFIAGAVTGVIMKIRLNHIAFKEIDRKEKYPGLALLSGNRNEDPNRILSNLISLGEETKFLLAFDRAKNLYGEARLDAAHHLKRAEILLKYQNYEKVAGTYLGFLMIYPDRPEAPEVRYSLGELFIHELNQPKKGMRYLEDIVNDKSIDESLRAQAKDELNKLVSPDNPATSAKV